MIRLTEERRAHIAEHPEMVGLEGEIAATLRDPDLLVASKVDATVELAYRFVPVTIVGPKYLVVVVKRTELDAFVVTAYVTDKPKTGRLLWKRAP